MPKTPYYQLRIEWRPVGITDESGKLVWGLGKPILNREIPGTLARLVHRGDRFSYRISLYMKDEFFPAAQIQDNGIFHMVTINDGLNNSLHRAFELTSARLNADRLYAYRVEMEQLFNEHRELFEVKSVGSDIGYVGLHKEEITVRKLDGETVLKESTHWTRRYKHVTTWTAKNVPAMIKACRELRMEAVQHGAQTV